jgi:hypothetical protein
MMWVEAFVFTRDDSDRLKIHGFINLVFEEIKSGSFVIECVCG